MENPLVGEKVKVLTSKPNAPKLCHGSGRKGLGEVASKRTSARPPAQRLRPLVGRAAATRPLLPLPPHQARPLPALPRGRQAPAALPAVVQATAPGLWRKGKRSEYEMARLMSGSGTFPCGFAWEISEPSEGLMCQPSPTLKSKAPRSTPSVQATPRATDQFFHLASAWSYAQAASGLLSQRCPA